MLLHVNKLKQALFINQAEILPCRQTSDSLCRRYSLSSLTRYCHISTY